MTPITFFWLAVFGYLGMIIISGVVGLALVIIRAGHRRRAVLLSTPTGHQGGNES